MFGGELKVLTCGVKISPPRLLLKYIRRLSDGERCRKIPLRNFSVNSSLVDYMNNLRLNARHGDFAARIPDEQLLRLLTIVQDCMRGLSLEDSVSRNKEIDSVSSDQDLNKVEPDVLVRKKAAMSESFESNRVKPSDPGFNYDVQKEFEPLETADWDSGESELEF